MWVWVWVCIFFYCSFCFSTCTAGIDGGIVVERVLENQEWGFGYNAATGNYENLLKTGVVDSAKVVINSLENSASIAAMVLTTECLVGWRSMKLKE